MADGISINRTTGREVPRLINTGSRGFRQKFGFVLSHWPCLVQVGKVQDLVCRSSGASSGKAPSAWANLAMKNASHHRGLLDHHGTSTAPVDNEVLGNPSGNA
jgi:hypothetical protein